MPKTRAELRGTGQRISAWLKAAIDRLGIKADELAGEVARIDQSRNQRPESLRRSIANYLSGADIPVPRTARSLGTALRTLGHPYASELTATVAAGHIGLFVLCLRWIAAKEYVFGDEHSNATPRRKRGNLFASSLCFWVPLAVEADIASVLLPPLYSDSVIAHQAKAAAEVDDRPERQGVEVADAGSDAEQIAWARQITGSYTKTYASEIHDALDLAQSGQLPPMNGLDELWGRGIRMGAAVQALVDAGAGTFEDKLDLLWAAMPVWANALQGADRMQDDGESAVVYRIRSRLRALES